MLMLGHYTQTRARAGINTDSTTTCSAFEERAQKYCNYSQATKSHTETKQKITINSFRMTHIHRTDTQFYTYVIFILYTKWIIFAVVCSGYFFALPLQIDCYILQSSFSSHIVGAHVLTLVAFRVSSQLRTHGSSWQWPAKTQMHFHYVLLTRTLISSAGTAQACLFSSPFLLLPCSAASPMYPLQQ